MDLYEISETLKEQKQPLSPTAVREVMKVEGFAALPRRLDEERPDRPRPTSGIFRWRRAGSRPHAADCFCSCRIDHAKTMRLLASWHSQVAGEQIFPGNSFNLDFHSAPYYGEHSTVQKHYVSMRSRRQPSILVFLAQDAETHAFCYSNADLRKGNEPEEIFRFINFWKQTHGKLPPHLVFDSKLTTYKGLARIDEMQIAFITLRRLVPDLLKDIVLLPRSAWRTVELDVSTRMYWTPRYYEQAVTLAGRRFRQMYIQDLGHEEPTILLTNQRQTSPKALITRYAQRMLSRMHSPMPSGSST